jgi:hypothetical protein
MYVNNTKDAAPRQSCRQKRPRTSLRMNWIEAHVKLAIHVTLVPDLEYI